MNGVLLFGWSTAVLFEVLRRTLRLGYAAAAAQRLDEDQPDRGAG
jgi:hypothetical protein